MNGLFFSPPLTFSQLENYLILKNELTCESCGYNGAIQSAIETEGIMTHLPKIPEMAFRREVLEATTPVLVEFSAAWCGPCKLLEPVLGQLMQEWAGRVRLVKLDVDEALQLTDQYQVRSVPTLILFKQGLPKERLSGFQPKERILTKLSPHLL